VAVVELSGPKLVFELDLANEVLAVGVLSAHWLAAELDLDVGVLAVGVLSAPRPTAELCLSVVELIGMELATPGLVAELGLAAWSGRLPALYLAANFSLPVGVLLPGVPTRPLLATVVSLVAGLHPPAGMLPGPWLSRKIDRPSSTKRRW